MAEWEHRKENGTYWTLPPWVELYDSLLFALRKAWICSLMGPLVTRVP